MAVTASTPANLVVGAGDVYLDGAVVGASLDSNLFRIEQEWADIDINGVPGKLKGTDYKTEETAILETTIPEVSSTIVSAQWPGSQSTTYGNVVVLDTDGTRRIPTTDYHDWELRVPGLDSREFRFLVDDALNTGNIEYEATDDGAMAPRLTLESRWDAADTSASPHRIQIITGATS